MTTESLDHILEGVSTDRILSYAAKTDKPNFRRILKYAAEQRIPRDKWVNLYCDYKDCTLFPLFDFV